MVSSFASFFSGLMDGNTGHMNLAFVRIWSEVCPSDCEGTVCHSCTCADFLYTALCFNSVPLDLFLVSSSRRALPTRPEIVALMEKCGVWVYDDMLQDIKTRFLQYGKQRIFLEPQSLYLMFAFSTFKMQLLYNQYQQWRESRTRKDVRWSSLPPIADSFARMLII